MENKINVTKSPGIVTEILWDLKYFTVVFWLCKLLNKLFSIRYHYTFGHFFGKTWLQWQSIAWNKLFQPGHLFSFLLCPFFFKCSIRNVAPSPLLLAQDKTRLMLQKVDVERSTSLWFYYVNHCLLLPIF